MNVCHSASRVSQNYRHCIYTRKDIFLVQYACLLGRQVLILVEFCGPSFQAIGQRTSDYTTFTLDPDTVFPRISDHSASEHTMDMTMSKLLSQRRIKYQYLCYKPLKSFLTHKCQTFVDSSLFQVPDLDFRF